MTSLMVSQTTNQLFKGMYKMLMNTQGQVVKLSKLEEQACRDATRLQQYIDKYPDVKPTQKEKNILHKRVEILKPLCEKLWPSGDKPDRFFQLGERARLV